MALATDDTTPLIVGRVNDAAKVRQHDRPDAIAGLETALEELWGTHALEIMWRLKLEEQSKHFR